MNEKQQAAQKVLSGLKISLLGNILAVFVGSIIGVFTQGSTLEITGSDYIDAFAIFAHYRWYFVAIVLVSLVIVVGRVVSQPGYVVLADKLQGKGAVAMKMLKTSNLIIIIANAVALVLMLGLMNTAMIIPSLFFIMGASAASVVGMIFYIIGYNILRKDESLNEQGVEAAKVLWKSTVFYIVDVALGLAAGFICTILALVSMVMIEGGSPGAITAVVMVMLLFMLAIFIPIIIYYVLYWVKLLRGWSMFRDSLSQ